MVVVVGRCYYCDTIQEVVASSWFSQHGIVRYVCVDGQEVCEAREQGAARSFYPEEGLV